MVPVKDQTKCRLMLLLFVYQVCLSENVVVSDTESGIVERISRRQTNDIYLFINSSSNPMVCVSNENTYLISEDQCVKDQELYRGKLICVIWLSHIFNHHSGCSHLLVPIQYTNLTTIAVFDSSTPNITYLLTKVTNGSEMFKFNETNYLVNSSFCYISSLEVYRGREQVIEISHQGFSLNSNGNIEVHVIKKLLFIVVYIQVSSTCSHL